MCIDVCTKWPPFCRWFFKSNYFSSIQLLGLYLQFYWGMFVTLLLTVSQHWHRWLHGTKQARPMMPYGLFKGQQWVDIGTWIQTTTTGKSWWICRHWHTSGQNDDVIIFAGMSQASSPKLLQMYKPASNSFIGVIGQFKVAVHFFNFWTKTTDIQDKSYEIIFPNEGMELCNL